MMETILFFDKQDNEKNVNGSTDGLNFVDGGAEEDTFFDDADHTSSNKPRLASHNRLPSAFAKSEVDDSFFSSLSKEQDLGSATNMGMLDPSHEVPESRVPAAEPSDLSSSLAFLNEEDDFLDDEEELESERTDSIVSMPASNKYEPQQSTQPPAQLPISASQSTPAIGGGQFPGAQHTSPYTPFQQIVPTDPPKSKSHVNEPKSTASTGFDLPSGIVKSSVRRVTSTASMQSSIPYQTYTPQPQSAYAPTSQSQSQPQAAYGPQQSTYAPTPQQSAYAAIPQPPTSPFAPPSHAPTPPSQYATAPQQASLQNKSVTAKKSFFEELPLPTKKPLAPRKVSSSFDIHSHVDHSFAANRAPPLHHQLQQPPIQQSIYAHSRTSSGGSSRSISPGSYRSLNIVSQRNSYQPSQSQSQSQPQPQPQPQHQHQHQHQPQPQPQFQPQSLKSPYNSYVPVANSAPLSAAASPPVASSSPVNPYDPSRRPSQYVPPAQGKSLQPAGVIHQRPSHARTSSGSYGDLPTDFSKYKSPPRSYHQALSPTTNNNNVLPGLSSPNYNINNNVRAFEQPQLMSLNLEHNRLYQEQLQQQQQQHGVKLDNEMLKRRQFPIFNWGYGNKACTLIPPPIAYGTTVGMAVKVTNVSNKILSWTDGTEKFPGPLVNTKGPIKSKKKELEKWCDEKIQKLEGEFTRRTGAGDQLLMMRLDHKVLLWKILRLLLKSEKSITNAIAENLQDVRMLLVPGSLPLASDENDLSNFKSVSELYDGHNYNGNNSKYQYSHHRRGSSLVGDPYVGARFGPEEAKMILNDVEVGNREGALRKALEKKLWPHAMVIASSLSPSHWNSVVAEFAREEIMRLEHGQSLALAYRVFSGAGYDSGKCQSF